MKPPPKPPPQPETVGGSGQDPDILFHEGLSHHQQGRLGEAQAIYEKLMDLHPRHFGAVYSLGVIAAQSGRHLEAVEILDRALAIDPHNVEALFNHGNLLHRLKRPREALESYQRLIQAKPDFADAHLNRGIVLQQLDRLQDALASFERFIQLNPGYGGAYFHRGNVLRLLERPLDALASYDKAIDLQPDHAQTYSNRGNVLKDLDRFEEALASYDKAIALAPGTAEAHYNRGNVLQELERREEAIAAYERAIELKPDFVQAHFTLSQCRLTLGDFARGWQGYESRWDQRRQSGTTTREFAAPLWLGEEPLTGKTILLHSEQGLGDALQFCRYAKMVHDLGASVILEARKPLVELLKTLDGVSHLIARGGPLPAFDYHCPLMSLPLAFNTELDTIPAPERYISADPNRVAAWQVRLGEKIRPRIGIAWSGDPWNRDRLNRSTGLAAMRALFCEDFEWFSLHNDLTPIDAALLSSLDQPQHFGEEMDFVETAAVIELMDLVISVDTSIAHLAGAMGKPLWILLPFRPDWRWLVDREESPWYPSARLFKQEIRGDWAGVMNRVGRVLKSRFEIP